MLTRYLSERQDGGLDDYFPMKDSSRLTEHLV